MSNSPNPDKLDQQDKNTGKVRDFKEQNQLEVNLSDLNRIFKETQEMAKLGYWKWNIKTGEVTWSAGVYKIFQRNPESFTPEIDSIMAMSPWEDTKNRHLELINLIKSKSDKRSFEQRFQRSDGSVGYYTSTFDGDFDDKGELLFIKGVVQDISERRLAEMALRESEEKYRSLFETMTPGVIYQDKEGRITSVNKSAERILGKGFQDMQGKSSRDSMWQAIHEDGSVFHGETHPSIMALKTRKPVMNTVMGVYNTVKKEHTWINISAVPQFLPGEDNPYQVYTTFEDITERKQTLQRLSLAQFSIDKASVSIYWLNSKGRLTYVNDEACLSLGYTRDELLKLYLWDIDPLYPKDRWDLNWKQYQRTENGFQNMESVQRRKNGETFPVEISSEHHWFGKDEFHVAFVRDITERKLIMETLKESEKRFRVIFEQAAVGVAQVMILSGQFSRVNKKYCDITGYTERETLNMSIEELTHQEDFQVQLDNIEKLKAGEIREFSMEKRYIRKNGSEVWVNLTVSPMWMPGEFPDYYIAIIEDITSRKQADEQIKESERSLKEMNATKDKLFTIISHDLRSPFQSIIGFSDMLSTNYDKLDEQKRQNYIEEIDNNAKKTYILLDNLLNWTMEQQGKIVIKKKAISVGQLVADSISPYLSLAKSKKIEIVSNIPKDVKINADKNTISTVIGNLVSNAIKFTNSGGKITVSASRKKSFLELVVTDTGIGMHPEMIERILSTEDNQPTPGTANELGTGLGLQLCKDLIDRNEGDFQIKSTMGKGSSFIISLPD
jgi:PAS domain S-box-containing protein